MYNQSLRFTRHMAAFCTFLGIIHIRKCYEDVINRCENKEYKYFGQGCKFLSGMNELYRFSYRVSLFTVGNDPIWRRDARMWSAVDRCRTRFLWRWRGRGRQGGSFLLVAGAPEVVLNYVQAQILIAPPDWGYDKGFGHKIIMRKNSNLANFLIFFLLL